MPYLVQATAPITTRIAGAIVGICLTSVATEAGHTFAPKTVQRVQTGGPVQTGAGRAVVHVFTARLTSEAGRAHAPVTIIMHTQV